MSAILLPIFGYAIYALAAVGAMLVLQAIWIGSDVSKITLISDPARLADATAVSNLDQLRAGLGTANWALSALMFVAVGIWMIRAYANFKRAGNQRARFHPLWAAAGLIIPVYNIFHGLVVANQIAPMRISSEPERIDARSIQFAQRTLLIACWSVFAFKLIGAVVYRGAYRLIAGADRVSIHDAVNLARGQLALHLINLLSCVLAGLVIWRISAHQVTEIKSAANSTKAGLNV